MTPPPLKIVAAGYPYCQFEKTLNYLQQIGEGVVLFGEDSFAQDRDNDWTIEQFAQQTKDMPMTIVGEKDGRIYIVNSGTITPAQRDYSSTEEEWEQYSTLDKRYDVSYDTHRKLRAITRICADGSRPYQGKGRADLLLIATAGIDWEERLDELVEAHEKALTKNALIVKSGTHHEQRFIFSLKERAMVGERKEVGQKDWYMVYEM